MNYNNKFFDPNERLGKICPKCGSDKVVFLMYGLMEDPEIDELIEKGEIVNLGCMINKENLGCKDCEHSWASTPIYID